MRSLDANHCGSGRRLARPARTDLQVAAAAHAAAAGQQHRARHAQLRPQPAAAAERTAGKGRGEAAVSAGTVRPVSAWWPATPQARLEPAPEGQRRGPGGEGEAGGAAAKGGHRCRGGPCRGGRRRRRAQAGRCCCCCIGARCQQLAGQPRVQQVDGGHRGEQEPAARGVGAGRGRVGMGRSVRRRRARRPPLARRRLPGRSPHPPAVPPPPQPPPQPASPGRRAPRGRPQQRQARESASRARPARGAAGGQRNAGDDAHGLAGQQAGPPRAREPCGPAGLEPHSLQPQLQIHGGRGTCRVRLAAGRQVQRAAVRARVGQRSATSPTERCRRDRAFLPTLGGRAHSWVAPADRACSSRGHACSTRTPRNEPPRAANLSRPRCPPPGAARSRTSQARRRHLGASYSAGAKAAAAARQRTCGAAGLASGFTHRAPEAG